MVKLFDSVLSQPLNSSMTCTYESKSITVETPTVQFHEKIEGCRAEGVEFGWTEQASRPPMAFHLPPTYQAPAVELPLPVMPDVTSKKFLPRPLTAPPPVFLRSDLPQTPLALPPPPAFQEPRAPSPPQEQPRSSSFVLPTPFPFYNRFVPDLFVAKVDCLVRWAATTSRNSTLFLQRVDLGHSSRHSSSNSIRRCRRQCEDPWTRDIKAIRDIKAVG